MDFQLLQMLGLNWRKFLFRGAILKLPITSGKSLIKALTKHGFIVIRQKGSHVRLEKRDLSNTTVLTVPLHKSLKKGTFKQILKDSHLKLEDLIEYLLFLN